MRYLIDTHCLLWHFATPGRLTSEARAALVDPIAELWLSTGSIWEMVIKESVGKLGLSEPVADFVGSRTAALRCKILGIVRGLRIPVSVVVDMVADSMPPEEILDLYPDLQREDISEALRFAAEAVRERELPLASNS